jgi:flagellar motor switch protein FliN/FliY
MNETDVLQDGSLPTNAAGTTSDDAAHAAAPEPASIGFLRDVELEASVELGRTNLSVEEVLRLAPGSVVHLNRMLGEPVDLIVGDRLIARGEVVVVDDTFGLRITEIVSRGSA